MNADPRSRYLDKPFLELLSSETSKSNPKFEYKQTNLSVKERHLDVFTPPSSCGRQGFDVVFDLTGETSAEKSELVS